VTQGGVSAHADDAPTAFVLLTGDELLEGRVRDTNGPYLSAGLREAGFEVAGLFVVPDDERTIAEAVRRIIADEPDLLVVSGGLGSTHDDVTLAAVAGATERPLARNDEAWSYVERAVRAVAARRHLDAEAILRQAEKVALLPAGARVIRPAGMAPGVDLEVGRTRIVVLPGVPHELETMWPDVLRTVETGRSPRVRLLRLHGVGETQVAPIVAAVPHEGVRVGITAGYGEVTVRLSADDETADTRAAELAAELSRALPVYSDDGRSVDELVADELVARGETLVVAESCSGGLLAGRLTDRPGSSAYFLGGVVSYADRVKREVLGVPDGLLRAHGAVSEPVAAAMAEGVRRLTGADRALAVTGIAGPDGGTAAKPVGLVFVAVADRAGTEVGRHLFPGDREAVRRQTVAAALHALRARLADAR